MLKYIPHIHLFQLYDKYYFYDTNTDAIMSLPKCVYVYLKKITKESIQEENESLFNKLDPADQNHIEKLIESGFLSKMNSNLKIKHGEYDKLTSFYNNNMKMVILQVTQNCNLRCKYCVYSGSYVNRVHNNKRMTWETAKASISYLHEHSRGSNDITIGFYGGEPLLEWELVKNAVDYAESLFSHKNLLFTMTTNATLITQDMINILSKHNFRLNISLDGPKDIQNSNRVFANENNNSFEIIMEKLKMMEEIAPEYLKSKVAFNAVIDLNQNVSCSNDFFLSYDIVKNLNVNGNIITDTNRKDETDVIPEYYTTAQYEIFKEYLYYCTTGLFQSYEPKLFSDVEQLKHSYFDRTVVNDADRNESTPGGQCIPGIQRFFVNAYGKFFPCERVDETCMDYCIGDLENGVDIEKAGKLLNIAEITSNECKKCWCFKLCTQCVSKAEENGHITRNARLSHCASVKRSIEHNIKNYITLRKCGCDFDELERKNVQEKNDCISLS